MNRSQKYPTPKISSPQGNSRFIKLLGPIFSLVGGASLVIFMGVGLLGSYQDRLIVAAAEAEESAKFIASGVSYPLPPRSEPEVVLSDLIAEDVQDPLPVQVEIPRKKPIIVAARATKKQRSISQRPHAAAARVESRSDRNRNTDWDSGRRSVSSPRKLDRYLRYRKPDLPTIPFDVHLHERIEASQPWLLSGQTGYSIQIMLVSHKTIGTLDDFVQRTGLEYSADDLYLFPLKDKRYLIYHGLYDSVKTAKLALKRLPESIKKSGAYIIPMQKIRAKVIKQQPNRRFTVQRY